MSEEKAQEELKDMMTANLIAGMMPKGIEEKIPGLIESLSPAAYAKIATALGTKNRLLFYFDPEYGLILQTLNMEDPNTSIKFSDPTANDVIIIQKSDKGISVIRNGILSNVKDLIKDLMANVVGKMF